MNWDAIGAIGQVIGSVAVLVTLVYLAIQVRHAQEQSKRAIDETRHMADQARLLGSRDTFLAAAANQSLASALARMTALSGSPLRSFDEYAVGLGLSEVEARQVWAFFSALWQNFEVSIVAVERLNSGVKAELDDRLRVNFRGSTGNAKWYELTKAGLNPDAVRYVDDLLTRAA